MIRSGINSLSPGGYDFDFKCVLIKCVVVITVMSNSTVNAFDWMAQYSTDNKSTLVQVMAWCHQATSHYLKQWCHMVLLGHNKLNMAPVLLLGGIQLYKCVTHEVPIASSLPDSVMDSDLVNPLCAELFWRHINISLHPYHCLTLSKTAQVVVIHLQGWKDMV